MYLTWNSGDFASFSTFPANTPAGAVHWPVSGFLMCGTTNVYTPAIAVMPSSSSSSQPRVRVALYQKWAPDASCQQGMPVTFGLQIYEKQATQGSFVLVKNGVGQTTGNPFGVSLSVAANNSTGELYLAGSQVDGLASTYIGYQNVWNNGQWTFNQILPRTGLTDIAAASCSKFRIAVSDITIGNGTYGPTWYRTGQWTGAVTGPTWAEPAGVQVSALGRDPQAFFWAWQSGLVTREVHVMFEEQLGNSYFVKHDAPVRTGRLLNDCRIRNIEDEKRAWVAQVRK